MDVNTIHFFPDALVVFVKGFRAQEIPREEDITVATTFPRLSDPSQNRGEVPELVSVAVSLTTKNSPGTFSLTITDTANRFIIPDAPESEIVNLYNRSHQKPKSYASAQKKIPQAGANYYEYTTYKDWLQFEWGTIEDITTGERMMVQYRRNANNVVVERWAFTSQGDIVYVVEVGDTQGEQDFQDALDGDVADYNVLLYNGKRSQSKKFRIYKTSNQVFLDKYKDGEEQGDAFARGRCKISPMDRLVIFMSRRFDSNGQIDSRPKHPLMRVFTGLVNTVQQGYAENQNTIAVNGEDITKYMRLSVVNINPALRLDDRAVPDQSAEGLTNISVWSNIFQGLRSPEIVRELILGSTAVTHKSGHTHADIKAIPQVTLSPTNSADVEYDPDLDVFVKHPSTSKASKTLDLKNMYGTLFTDSTVHIIDPTKPGSTLSGYSAYKEVLNNSWSFYQADFKTRRDIAYQMAEDTHFAFYSDRNGDIWFTPPRYHMGHITAQKFPQVYILDTPSIISYGFVEDDSQVFSSVYVGTEPPLGLSTLQSLGTFNGACRDETVILKYGQRIFICSNPIIRSDAGLGLHSEDCDVYAKSLLQRLLAGKYQGQVTLLGRPELEQNMPVYIPMRNMMYYVETVEHTLTFGGQFTTTVHLAYGHKPWELLPEVLAFSKNDEVYLTDGNVNVVSTKKTSNEQTQENIPKYTSSATAAGTSILSPTPFQQAKVDTTKVVQSTTLSSGSLPRLF
jgi:hypothetical protein